MTEPTTIRDTAQEDSISEHRHPYGPTPTRGQAKQEHVSTKSLGKETCYQAARTNPPPTNSVIVWFIFMYIVLLSVSVLLHSVLTVLIWFVKICVCRDLYTTCARMHIASP